MSIEARGARYAYVYSGASILNRMGTSYIRHALGFLAADGVDEAYGVAMKAMLRAYPVNDGWQAHDVLLRRIDDADWIGRLDLDTIDPVKV
jgi:hypothetical protein